MSACACYLISLAFIRVTAVRVNECLYLLVLTEGNLKLQNWRTETPEEEDVSGLIPLLDSKTFTAYVSNVSNCL